MPSAGGDEDPDEVERRALVQAIFGPSGRLASAMGRYESRHSQETMALAVLRAVERERHLMVEADTGTGKTLAYLLPLLASGQRFIVSTATKALQDQIIDNDLPLIRQTLGTPFSAVALKGRGNYLCIYRLRLIRHTPNMIPRREKPLLGILDDWSRDTATGDRDELPDLPEGARLWMDVNADAEHCLGQKCQDFDDCHLVRIRKRALRADLVVVNHHLFCADLSLKDDGFGEILPDHPLVVFDEAHRLPDVVTRHFGLELSNHQISRLVSDCRREFIEAAGSEHEISGALEMLELAGRGLMQAFVSPGGEGEQCAGLDPQQLQQAPGRALLTLEQALHHMMDSLEPHRVRSAGLAACGRRVESLLETAGSIRALDDPNRVYWYEIRGRGVYLQASPLETGTTLRQALLPRYETTIYASATLTTGEGLKGFEYLRLQLGLPEEETDRVRLDPVFDYAHQGMLYLPMMMPPPQDHGFAEGVTQSIRHLLAASGGRALLLFTSYRMLHAVQSGLGDDLPFTVLIQGERSRRALLDTFMADNSSVLLATSSFWEGVDVPGDALSLVVVDKLPFPSPGDPLNAARARLLESRGENPFVHFYLPRAVLALKQGVGRLIRRRDDRGIMAVLDIRLATQWYGKRFIAGLPKVPLTRDMTRVQAFFDKIS